MMMSLRALGERLLWSVSRTNVLCEAALVEGTAEDDGDTGLRRDLGLVDLVAFGIGSTIGSGIFITAGIMAATAGPALVVSFVIAGIACFLTTLAYAEMATRLPSSGSAYTFAYVCLGELAGWFVGWCLTLCYGVGTCIISRAWAQYLQQVLDDFSVSYPSWMFSYHAAAIFDLNLVSIFVMLFTTAIALFGVKDSSRMNIVLTVINLGSLVFIVVLGATRVDTANWTPFMPRGLSGVFNASTIAFYSFIGFDTVTMLSEEVSNPARQMPVGLFLVLSAAAGLYIAVGLVVTGMVPWAQVSQDAPLAAAFSAVGYPWAAKLIGIVTLVSLMAGCLCSITGQARIFHQMARDGLLPAKFMEVNRFGSPWFSVLLTGLGAGVTGVLFKVEVMSEAVSVVMLFVYTLVALAVLVLRTKDPVHPYRPRVVLLAFFAAAYVLGVSIKEDAPLAVIIVAAVVSFLLYLAVEALPVRAKPRKFSTPFVPLVPALAIFFNTYMISKALWDSMLRSAIWTAVGLLIYFVYGVRFSQLNRLERDAWRAHEEKYGDDIGSYPDHIVEEQERRREARLAAAERRKQAGGGGGSGGGDDRVPLLDSSVDDADHIDGMRRRHFADDEQQRSPSVEPSINVTGDQHNDTRTSGDERSMMSV